MPGLLSFPKEVAMFVTKGYSLELRNKFDFFVMGKEFLIKFLREVKNEK